MKVCNARLMDLTYAKEFVARHAELASIVTRASGRQGSLWKLLPDWDSFMDHLEKATYNNQPNLS